MGIHREVAAIPPGKPRASTSSVRAPRVEAASAAPNPAGPAPATNTS